MTMAKVPSTAVIIADPGLNQAIQIELSRAGTQ